MQTLPEQHATADASEIATSGSGITKTLQHSPEAATSEKPCLVILDSKRNLLRVVQVKSYGILGMSSEGKKVEPPDEITVLVDPAGLTFVQDKGPGGAKGAAAVIYKWLEISEDESFPQDVRQAITEECHAKYHSYADDKKKCIHVVGPDFRKIDDMDFTEDNAVDKLAVAYRNVFEEFCKVGAEHGLKNMRLLPISGGIFSGRFKENLPEITVRAVQAAYEQLAEDKKQRMMNSSIEMCIFMESEFDMFASAFGQSRSDASEDSAAEAGMIAVSEQHATADASEIATSGSGITKTLQHSPEAATSEKTIGVPHAVQSLEDFLGGSAVESSQRAQSSQPLKPQNGPWQQMSQKVASKIASACNYLSRRRVS
eukprot:Skav213121  [mRNA]  locus=scaffold107:93559:94671:+ [translate_table: standard]